MSSVQRTLELVWIVCYQAIQKMRQKRFFRCPLVRWCLCALFADFFFCASTFMYYLVCIVILANQ